MLLTDFVFALISNARRATRFAEAAGLVAAKDCGAREKAREKLKPQRGHFINFYGSWAAEVLETWSPVA